MKLTDVHEPDAVNLLSFGAGSKEFTLANIESLSKMLHCAYVDSQRLPAVASSYTVKDKHHIILNVWWQEYYKKAMEKADFLTFIITEGWLKSGNCWQELDWASKIRNISTGKITLFIFTKQEYYDRLEANQDYKD